MAKIIYHYEKESLKKWRKFIIISKKMATQHVVESENGDAAKFPAIFEREKFDHYGCRLIKSDCCHA